MNDELKEILALPRFVGKANCGIPLETNGDDRKWRLFWKFR